MSISVLHCNFIALTVASGEHRLDMLTVEFALCWRLIGNATQSNESSASSSVCFEIKLVSFRAVCPLADSFCFSIQIQRYFIDLRGGIRIPVQPIQTYIMTQDKGGTGHRGFAAHSQALPLLDEKRGHIR
ncbi:hypothetical protein ILYODFUR_037667 [Ilyodon furcidens]|uniref:Uncharacterized protein n=1 Tax=Ilyodon furcidens TaxID=33524 RepID=A0ABV0TQH2_9TELE